ncbi:hypothetical protein N0V82_010153 [Gnomoniopsis sp. IMI 355080]|nr:hypothetical protein N0V82_010153 [Gnomoniopsis sp. IMI 355080]
MESLGYIRCLAAGTDTVVAPVNGATGNWGTAYLILSWDPKAVFAIAMVDATTHRSAGAGDEDAPLLQPSSSDTSSLHAHDHSRSAPTSSYRSDAESDCDFDSQSQINRRRRRAALVTQRNISFVSAVAGASCAGSITVFSLYGHLFQERLRYSQYQVNGVAVVASFALYLSNTVFGYICDRRGPSPLCALSAALCAIGYGLAAALYKHGASYPPSSPTSLTYGLMMFAFILIGTGSCALYSASVSSCAKNFGKGKYRGLALAIPITAVGLSGVWQSQVASRLLYETLPDGTRGDVNVFYFFLFLAVLFCLVGIMGTFLMKVIDEDELIDEAVEELERSGLLDPSGLFSPTHAHSSYGSFQRSEPDLIDHEVDARHSVLAKDLDDDAISKKNWVLNAETRRFFGDHTMWFFAAGFFLVIGPAEAFINNMGTVIKTLYSPDDIHLGATTSAATHVSIICAASTVVRLLVGALTDLLAPAPATQHLQIPIPDTQSMLQRIRFSISRVSFWIFFAIILSLGMSILASGVIQDHGERFWVVSASVGAGYGALFSITPIIVTIIWGVENFGTNWGIMYVFLRHPEPDPEHCPPK